MGSDNFCLRWNDFESNVSGSFKELRDEADFFDVTLVTSENKHFKAHKVILSACSTFFKNMLRKTANYSQGGSCPLIYLRGIAHHDFAAILDFMYNGEVNVAQDELNSFLHVAEDLQIKGLTQKNSNETGNQSTAGSGGASAGANRKVGAKSKSSFGNSPVPSSAAKKPRPFPSLPKTPVPIASVPSSNNGGGDGGGVDDEYKEVVDVKNEPLAESPSAGPSVSSAIGGAAQPDDYDDASGEAYDDSFAEDGYYDDAGMMGMEGGATAGGDPSDNSKGGFDLDGLIDRRDTLILTFLDKSEGSWICTSCGKSSKDKTDIKRHVESKHVKETLQCPECSFNTNTVRQLSIHFKKRHPHLYTPKKNFVPHSCNFCPFKTMNLKVLRKHVVQIHSNTASTATSFVTPSLPDNDPSNLGALMPPHLANIPLHDLLPQ